MIKLQVSIKVPHETPREFELSFDTSVVTIGREPDNQVQIPLSTVSRHHARFVQEGSEWFIEDLKSTHGTLVNRKPLGSGGRKLLKSGDEIQVVHAFMIFDYESKPAILPNAPEEQTSVVARQLVQEVLKNLDSNADAPHLVIVNGPLQGTKIELPPNMNDMIVGRADTCDIKLDDVNISRRHAKISRRWNHVFIEDLKSKNGVSIDGQKITKSTELNNGAEIEIGPIRIAFVDTTAGLLGKLGEMPAFEKEMASIPPPEPEPETELEVEGAETQIPPAPTAPVTPQPASAPVAIPAIHAKLQTIDYVLFGLTGLVAVGLIIGLILLFMD